MKTQNRVELIGHVGMDPEVRTTKGGTRVASLSIATNRTTGDGEATDWHRITMWDKLAGLAMQHIRKGDPLWVEGRLRYSTSGDEDNKRYWTEIVATRVILLDPPHEKSAGTSDGN